MAGIPVDISGRKQLELELEHQATHDSLTGLANRALLMRTIQQAMDESGERGIGVALFFVDLDDFKVVNDSMGHEAGDVLLVEVGQRLTRLVPESDVVARFGGDEFVLVVSGIANEQQAGAFAWGRVHSSTDGPSRVRV